MLGVPLDEVPSPFRRICASESKSAPRELQRHVLFVHQQQPTYEALKDDPAAFTVWQDIDQSLATEDDASTLMLHQAMTDDRELIAKGLMTQEEFDQEWYLSTNSAIKGAYYTKQLTAARKEGRITRVPYDPALPVDTDWDLGISDKMSIWFSQSLPTGEVRLIDYYENEGEGFVFYAGVLKERGYVYGEHWAPHDIRVRELGTGKSRLETAKAHGINFQVTPNVGVADGIDRCRAARGVPSGRTVRQRSAPGPGRAAGAAGRPSVWTPGASPDSRPG